MSLSLVSTLLWIGIIWTLSLQSIEKELRMKKEYVHDYFVECLNELVSGLEVLIIGIFLL